jgi:hypothetical protein
MTFYFILCLLFSLMLDVLGLANYRLAGGFRDTFYTYPCDDANPPVCATTKALDFESPGIEY